jgi:hypothetical protein
MQYKTSDIVLAACLKINNYELDTITVETNGKGTFVFNNVSNDFLQNFDFGKILVEPITFNNTIKQLTTSVRRLNKSFTE